MFFKLLLPISIVSLICGNQDKNEAIKTNYPPTTQQPGYFTASVNGNVFQSSDAVTTGIFNPITKLNTFSGEDKASTMISVSFPPTLQVNESCNSCEANITVTKNNSRITYYSNNISHLQFRITVRKGNWITGSFSFTAQKASNDMLEVTNGKFAGHLE